MSDDDPISPQEGRRILALFQELHDAPAQELARRLVRPELTQAGCHRLIRMLSLVDTAGLSLDPMHIRREDGSDS